MSQKDTVFAWRVSFINAKHAGQKYSADETLIFFYFSQEKRLKQFMQIVSIAFYFLEKIRYTYIIDLSSAELA